MDFETLENQLRGLATLKHGLGATEKEIARAEQSLGVKITGGYRQFLIRFGWAEFAYEDIYGLGPDAPEHLNLVTITRDERSAMVPGLRKDILPLMNDGGGNHYCLDLQSAPGGLNPEPSVVFWSHNLDEDQVPEFVSGSFVEWLSSRLGSSET